MNDKIMLALEPNQGHALALKKELQNNAQTQNREIELAEAV